ncbi:MAG: hypothetical protein KDB23_31395, partial [Planctomycetales bacterium]|nr:hypothetical protein [Planctomycetales bacterium]
RLPLFQVGKQKSIVVAVGRFGGRLGTRLWSAAAQRSLAEGRGAHRRDRRRLSLAPPSSWSVWRPDVCHLASDNLKEKR